MKTMSNVLKALGYILGISGGIMFFYGVAALEQDLITIPQCFGKELIAFGLIALAFIVYIIRSEINDKYIINK